MLTLHVSNGKAIKQQEGLSEQPSLCSQDLCLLLTNIFDVGVHEWVCHLELLKNIQFLQIPQHLL